MDEQVKSEEPKKLSADEKPVTVADVKLAIERIERKLKYLTELREKFSEGE